MTRSVPVESIALDQMFDALCRPYRRRILARSSHRDAHDEPEFTPDELVVANDETDSTSIVLYSYRLPKLAAAGWP